jgi:hypothetical protein
MQTVRVEGVFRNRYQGGFLFVARSLSGRSFTRFTFKDPVVFGFWQVHYIANDIAQQKSEESYGNRLRAFLK